jgi:hypothetical protein
MRDATNAQTAARRLGARPNPTLNTDAHRRAFSPPAVAG